MGQSSAIPFRPIFGSVVSIAATTTSGNIAIPISAYGATAVRITVSTGTANVRVRTGVGAGTAAVAADPLFSATGIESIGINAIDTFVAAKTDAGTCTVEFCFGFGS